MIKDRGLSFEIQVKIEFLPLYNGSKKCLEKSLRKGATLWWWVKGPKEKASEGFGSLAATQPTLSHYWGGSFAQC